MEDESTVAYMCSSGYQPDREFAIRATDPAIAVDWPISDVALSDRDAAAPLLADVRAAELLPTWDEARTFTDGLH